MTQYIGQLEEIRDTARSRLEGVQEVENRCPSHHCDDPVSRQIDVIRSHARHADVLALNDISYGIAQDIAAGNDKAEQLEPIALEYTKELDRTIQDGDASFANGKLRDKTEREGYRDTVAFVTLVAEGRKQSPDVDKIRNAIASFEQVIAYVTEVLAPQGGQSKNPNDPEQVLLNSARAHLSSARALLQD